MPDERRIDRTLITTLPGARNTTRPLLLLFLQSVHLPMTLPVLLAEQLSSSMTRSADIMIRIRMTIKHVAAFLRHICTERQFAII